MSIVNKDTPFLCIPRHPPRHRLDERPRRRRRIGAVPAHDRQHRRNPGSRPLRRDDRGRRAHPGPGDPAHQRQRLRQRRPPGRRHRARAEPAVVAGHAGRAARQPPVHHRAERLGDAAHRSRRPHHAGHRTGLLGRLHQLRAPRRPRHRARGLRALRHRLQHGAGGKQPEKRHIGHGAR